MDMSLMRLMNSIGQVIRWPKKIREKLFILTYLISKFEDGKEYSELEVNRVLGEWHVFNDPAMLRRELFNRYLLDRTPDGKKYWVQKKDEATGI